MPASLAPLLGALLLLLNIVQASATAEAVKLPEESESFTRQFKTIGFHLGGHTEFMGAVQTDTQGTRPKFRPAPMVGFSADVMVTDSWRLVPEINWMLPQSSDGVMRNLWMVRLDGAWQGGEWWRLRVGTSIMVNNIRGGGGTVTLDNGDSTSEFYLPSESKTAVNNTFDLGAEVFLRSFAFRLQTYTYALARSDRRQVSYTLIASYYHDLWGTP